MKRSLAIAFAGLSAASPAPMACADHEGGHSGQGGHFSPHKAADIANRSGLARFREM